MVESRHSHPEKLENVLGIDEKKKLNTFVYKFCEISFDPKIPGVNYTKFT